MREVKISIFDGEEIRDTSDHASTLLNLEGYGGVALKTIIIENQLDQPVTLQCKASGHDDFSRSFDVGSSFEVAANTNTCQTCESFFLYFKMVATCASAPTSGDLTVIVFGRS